MIVLAIFIVIQILFITTIFILAGNRYKAVINFGDDKFQLLFMAPVSLYIIDKGQILELFSKFISNLHFKIIKIYGSKHGIIYSKLFLAQIISIELILLLFSSALSLINSDIVLLYFGLVLLVIFPIKLIRDLDNEINKKQEQIIIELPEFLNKIILLINAGETVQQAMVKSVLKNNDVDNSYLYKELLISVNQIQNNIPLHQVLDELSKRCGTQEVSVFTTTVLLNYRRGSGDMVISLTKLSQELWDKRIALSRTIGEQASSKLVFPMVLIFIVVLIIVGTPAIMMF